MDVIASLKEERDQLESELEKIDAAIRILGGQASPAKNGASRPKTGGHISAEGRRRLSEMMKKRWAERRKAKQAGKRPASR